MPDISDPFLRSAVELGLIGNRAAEKAERQAAEQSVTTAALLLDRGELTPRQAEQVEQLLRARQGPAVRSGTRRGRSVRAPSTASGGPGMAIAALGFAVVLAAGLFLFKAQIFGGAPAAVEENGEPARVVGVTTPRDDGTSPVANPSRETVPELATGPTKAGGDQTGENEGDEAKSEREGAAGAPAQDNGKRAVEKGTAGDLKHAGRDPKVLRAADKAFDEGEKWNKQVTGSGEARAAVMVKALDRYTEALTLYRRYCGTRVPSFLEKRYRALNSNIAMLRKLLPPDKIKPFVTRLTEERRTAKELFAGAEAAVRESPRDYANNFMMFQRVLDEHPGSAEAVRAFARIGEIGWAEIESINRRRAFGELAKGWAKRMRAGEFAEVRAALARVSGDEEARAAMQSEDWAIYQTFERALRVPKDAAAKLVVGEQVAIRTSSGVVKGRVDKVTSSVVVIDGRPLVLAKLPPATLVTLALGDRLTGSRALTKACFLAVLGDAENADKALTEARRKGAPVDDYVTVIDQLGRTH